jgi:hypothetical protein
MVLNANISAKWYLDAYRLKPHGIKGFCNIFELLVITYTYIIKITYKNSQGKDQ